MVARKNGKFAKKWNHTPKIVHIWFFVTEKIQILWKEKIMDIFVFFSICVQFCYIEENETTENIQNAIRKTKYRSWLTFFVASSSSLWEKLKSTISELQPKYFFFLKKELLLFFFLCLSTYTQLNHHFFLYACVAVFVYQKLPKS